MPDTLFGALNQASTNGNSSHISACYVSNNVIAYVSGNAINFRDIEHSKHARTQEHDGKYYPSILATNQITALATFAQEGIIAYAETQSTDIKIVKWPQATRIGVNNGVLSASDDLEIVSLTFSADGQYLASLGSLPNHTISIWDWRGNIQRAHGENSPLLTSASNLGPARQISFNPVDKRMICTCNPKMNEADPPFPEDEFDLDVLVGEDDGLCRGVRFWKISMGFKRWDLTPMYFFCNSRSFADELAEPIRILPPTHSINVNSQVAAQSTPMAEKKPKIALGHIWRSDQSVIVSTNQNVLLLYSPLKNTCRELPVAQAAQQNQINTGAEDISAREKDESKESNTAKAVESENDANFTVHCMLYSKDLIICAGERATVTFVKTETPMPYISRNFQIGSDSNACISSISFSPKYDSLIACFKDGRIFLSGIQGEHHHCIVSPDANRITCIDSSRLSDVYFTGTQSGEILVWEPDVSVQGNPPRQQVRKRVYCGGSSVSAISASQYSSRIVAVGSVNGYVRIVNVKYGDDSDLFDDEQDEVNAVPEEEASGSVIFRQRLFRKEVKKILFDPTGNFLLACSNSGYAALIEVKEDFKVIGLIEFTGEFQSAAFNYEEYEEEGREHTIPLNKSQLTTEENLFLSKNCYQCITYRIESVLVDIGPVPYQLAAGKELFYVVSSDDKKLMAYAGITQPQYPPGKTATGNKSAPVEKTDTLLAKPLFEVNIHEKGGCHLKIGHSIDWMYTFSEDGTFVIKSLLEQDKEVRVNAHDPFQGGIKDMIIGSAGRGVYSLGFDGTLKSWDWERGGNGKKMITEAVAELERMIVSKAGQIKKYMEVIKREGVADYPDSLEEKALDDFDQANEKDRTIDAEQEVYIIQQQDFTLKLREKINEVKEKVTKIIRQNETMPQLERLDKEEFVLDFKERDRLLAEADARIDAVRKSIETANLTKIVIQQRIKKECWDSMQVVGQSVKSFNADPLTGNTIEVTNYPLRIRPQNEIDLAAKIKLLRKTEIVVNKESNPKDRQIAAEDLFNDEDSSPSDAKTDSKAAEKDGISSLLYDPFDLITVERRRMQAVLMSEQIHELKLAFNRNFLNFAKLKREGISKIEEKNERIKSIMDELQIKEAIMHPELDDDEVPERIIEVLDSEFVTPEERRKLEEKRLQEEERLRAQKQDNWAERALMQMMGGKLEDRSDQEEKVELVRPDWMNKPKEEMNEEERKLVKEFEKKVATFKEEQEKYKKALETELRKLQSAITEICDNFDKSLSEFFNSRIRNDQIIYQTELKLIKLNQTSVFGEHDELKEQEIITRLEHLKGEKMAYMAEIPEIKKDLERCREEYDQVVKRDKEVERQFKKEFHSYDFYYDSLMKLFKRRELVTDSEMVSVEQKQISNPFIKENEKANVWEDPPGLNIELDLPEGLSSDLWNKLVELRDKKILLEQETFMAYNRFSEMQILVQAVLDESERIRTETDKLTADLNQFLDYKFHTTYNVESLLELKQGQVEIPQAPVVTDYSDAVLIHRGCVERLNESIVGLGKTKVDALREIKEYRKGIHALEWENKMLDFQAEDAIIRTRDIQLLRLTKQMQEYLRSGDEYAQTTEILALEKRAEYSQKAHLHKLEEKTKTLSKLRRKIQDKSKQNDKLDDQLKELAKACEERTEIFESSSKNTHQSPVHADSTLLEIYNRRRLVDLAKAQAQDISILREEVERLRLRTYPAFSASIKRK